MKATVYIIKAKNEGEDGDVYIGSTIQKLYKRWSVHRSIPERCINKLYVKYGLDNLVCEVLEEIDVEDRQELFRRERFYIETIPCINRRIPLRTKQEYGKIYNRDNKEAKSLLYKEWYNKNREYKALKNKEYRDKKKAELLNQK